MCVCVCMYVCMYVRMYVHNTVSKWLAIMKINLNG